MGAAKSRLPGAGGEAGAQGDRDSGKARERGEKGRDRWGNRNGAESKPFFLSGLPADGASELLPLAPALPPCNGLIWRSAKK